MASAQRNLVLGLALLVIGFVAGFYAGTQSAPAAKPVVAGGAPPQAPMENVTSMGTLPAPHRGHTFTGKIDVPPHSDEAHKLADVMLKDVRCPCGGCQNMNIGECGCDTAREIGGVAAHLFERGNTGDVVLAKLATRYELEVSDAVRAQAATMRLPNPQLVDGAGGMDAPPMAAPAVTPAIPADIQSILSDPGVQRLTDVPTGARPHPTP